MLTILTHRCFRLAERDEYQTHHEEYLERQKELVSEELRPEHSNLILDFLYDSDDDLAPSTARNYCRELRFLIRYSYDSDAFNAEPEGWGSDNWNRLIRRVMRQRDAGDGTRRNTAYAVRKFISWSIESDADKSEIDAPKRTHEKIDQETVLSPDEVVGLIESTRTERDAGLIAVMYEAALRRTALVQLDVKNYLEEPFARVRVPQKVGVKTGSGRERPLNWSRGYLDRWMNQHPDPENPDAPLFCSIRSRDEGERLTSHAVYTMLQRTAKRSDVDKDRVHPHALRHARATAMRQSDRLDKKDIETVMGWTESTPMHQRYEHTTSTEDASRTARRMGVEVGGDEAEITECPRCGSNLPPDSRFCPNCTLRISGEAPDWFQLFQKVAKDTDPLLQRYNALPSAVPDLRELSPEELDHLREILLFGEAKMYEDGIEEDLPHPYDGVTAFQFEDDGSAAWDIAGNIGDMLGSMYEESPEQFELIKESVDIEGIRERAGEQEE